MKLRTNIILLLRENYPEAPEKWSSPKHWAEAKRVVKMRHAKRIVDGVGPSLFFTDHGRRRIGRRLRAAHARILANRLAGYSD